MKINNIELAKCFESLIKLEEEKQVVSEHIKSIYSNLKSEGHDVDAIKKIVSDHKKDLKRILEVEQWVDVYRNALGIVPFAETSK